MAYKGNIPWNKGRKMTASYRAKISAANTGRQATASTKAKISKALTGRPVTPSTRAKISKALKGQPFTAERRAKISAANKRRWTSEQRAKFSAAHKGRPLTAEHRARISLAQRWRVGDKAGRWKGGRRKTTAGYVHIYSPEHPYANSRGCVYEHRLVLEAHLGRTLLPTEVVHHINSILDDNRVENLLLFSSSAEHLKSCHKGKKKVRGLGDKKCLEK